MGGMKRAIGLAEKIGAVKKVEPETKKETKKETKVEPSQLTKAKRRGRATYIKTSASGDLTSTKTDKKTLLG